MKNLSKKSISLVLIFTILMAIFMPSMVNAGGIGQTGTSTVKTDELQKESTVYAGEIFVDGSSQMQWLYSSDISNQQTVFENLKTSLNGTTFADLVPTLDENTDNNGLAVSSSHQSDMNNSWTSANYVANQFYTGTIGTETNGNLYDNNTTYKNNIDTSYSSHQGEVDNPIDFSKRVLSTLSVASDYEIVSIEGVPTKVITITFNLEATTVNYTRVDVTTSSTPTTTTPINSLNINVASPKVGDTATSTTKPNVTIDSNPNYEIDHIAYITAYPSEKPMGEYDMPFTGTFEDGKEYYVEVSLHAKDGYVFRDNNNMTLKVNGKTTGYEMSEWNSDNSPYYMFYTKVSATSESEETAPTTYEHIDDTANQTYTINKDDTLTFRINADYSLFENGGKVYVDGTETTEYTSKSGSTVITLNNDFVNSLSVGEHTLKVAFNNGGEATTKFTIAKAEETTPTETATTEEAKTEESTLKNPKTGDNIIMTISIFAIATLGAYTTLKVNRSRKMRKH